MHPKDIERIQQEVHTANHNKMHQRRKDVWKDSELPIKIQESKRNPELKISHHNHLLESKINPTLDDYINVKHKSLFERLKGLL